MTVIDSLVIEIGADASKMATGIGQALSHVNKFDQQVSGLEGGISKVVSAFGPLTTAVTTAVGVFGKLSLEMKYIVDHAKELKSTGWFSNEEIEQAEKFHSVLSGIAADTLTLTKNLASRGGFEAMSFGDFVWNGLNSATGGSFSGLAKSIGATYNPANDKAIRPDQIKFKPGSMTPSWAGVEQTQAANERVATVVNSLLPSHFGTKMARGLTDVFEKMEQMGIGASEWMYEMQSAQWAREGEIHERKKRQMAGNVGTAGISLGDTAQGYAELRQQMNQTKELVDENRKQTNVLSQILEAARATFDPFDNH